MQKPDVVSFKIGDLLFELSWCINDLHGFTQQFSLDDIQKAELSLQKLNALINHVKRSTSLAV